MSDFSRRRHTLSPVILSKKLSHGHGFYSDKSSPYDGVFSSKPPKLGVGAAAPNFLSRVEDYAEIFKNSSGSCSSIPVLDFPSLDDSKAFTDLKKSEVDYEKIFGGFNDVEFGVAQEDFIIEPKRGNFSFTQVRTTDGVRSSSEGADTKLPKENKQTSFSEPYYESVQGAKKFNMSYHKAAQRSKDGTNGMTYVAQLQSVPGYAQIIDDLTPLQKNGISKLVKPVVQDDFCDSDSSSVRKEREVVHEEMPSLQNDGALKQNPSLDVKFQSKPIQNGSFMNGIHGGSCFAAHPGHTSKLSQSTSMPPQLFKKNDEFEPSIALKHKVFRCESHTGVLGDRLPPSLEEEVDPNTVAATSAAALGKAIEEAQAQIRVAKQLFARGGVGFQRSVKSFKSSSRVKDEHEARNASEPMIPKEAIMQDAERVTKMHIPAGSGKQNETKPDPVAPDSGEEDTFYEAEEEVRWESHEQEPKSIQADQKQVGSGVWESAEKVHELRKEEFGVASVAVEEATFYEAEEEVRWESHEQEPKSIQADQKQVGSGVWESAEKVHELRKEEFGVASVAVEEANIEKMMQFAERHDHCKEGRATTESLKQGDDFSEKNAAVKDVHRCDVERLQNGHEAAEKPEDVNPSISIQGVHVQGKMENISVPASEQEGKWDKIETSEDNDLFNTERLSAAPETMEIEDFDNQKTNELQETRELENIYVPQGWEESHNAQRLGGTEEHSEVKQKEVHEEEKNGKILEEIHEREGNGRRVEDDCGEKENQNGKEQACQWLETEEVIEIYWHELNDGNLEINLEKEDAWKSSDEENEKRMEEECDLEGTEKLEDVIKEKEKRPSMYYHKEENEKILEEADDWEESESIERKSDLIEEVESSGLGQVVSEQHDQNLEAADDAHKQFECTSINRTVEACSHDEKILEEADDREESENIERKSDLIEEVESSGLDQVVSEQDDQNLEAADDAHKQFESTSINRTVEACSHDDYSEDMEVTPKENNNEENWRMMGEGRVNCESESNEKDLKALNMACQLDQDEIFGTCPSGSLCEHDEIQENVESPTETNDPDENSEFSSDEAEMNAIQKQIYQNEKGPRVDSDLENDKQTHEWIENVENWNRDDIAADQERDEENFISTPAKKKPDQDEIYCEASQLADTVEEKRETPGESMQEPKTTQHAEAKEDTCETSSSEESGSPGESAQELKTTQNAEATEDTCKTSSSEESGSRGTLENEELEMEYLSRRNEAAKEDMSETSSSEESWSRGTLESEELKLKHLSRRNDAVEKERHRERLAVEKVIREARERAFAEAQERAEKAAAEKATAEAQQRAMANAREKLEKPFATVKDKTFSDKASTVAKLRAERAAVERATAEARQRALEKALMEKSSGASKDSKVGQRFSSDQSYKSSGPRRKVPNTDEGAKGESAERCKAMLERDQRTAERAAKALAEKNMRDLLAQKEQAERNRLAESLDAEVKRWASGKERNLRALLSTLQYILGSNSGWQPTSLTDLITADAVKKAYRRATLCVHPDKLQQRGASIQQKYICEKVFDLLKDAWNKFSSEER
ncbi:hypothetical protein RJ641_032351 [Dillenia turbinata]|uniref:J domain-containing protein n=1 Tax=Dillenia turbinata TaxID=194707 RepID=A0AAN8VPL1_9MAGN